MVTAARKAEIEWQARLDAQLQIVKETGDELIEVLQEIAVLIESDREERGGSHD